MPYKTVWEENGVLWEYTGNVSSDDLLNSNNEFYCDSRAETVLYQISDFSNVHSHSVDNISIEQVAAMDYGQSHTSKNIKAAFIVHPDKAGAIIEYITLAKELQINWSFKIFEDIGSARKWVSSDIKDR